MAITKIGKLMIRDPKNRAAGYRHISGDEETAYRAKVKASGKEIPVLKRPSDIKKGKRSSGMKGLAAGAGLGAGAMWAGKKILSRGK